MSEEESERWVPHLWRGDPVGYDALYEGLPIHLLSSVEGWFNDTMYELERNRSGPAVQLIERVLHRGPYNDDSASVWREMVLDFVNGSGVGVPQGRRMGVPCRRRVPRWHPASAARCCARASRPNARRRGRLPKRSAHRPAAWWCRDRR